MIRTSLLALTLLTIFASAANAQNVRRSGPADPRYYPDLYKGPAWGMTLSEYYTFGNKADGPYGYAIGGYRYGSNYDVQRWKQATGTEIPPGYYLQRWREKRAERLGTEPAPAVPPQHASKPSRKSVAEPTNDDAEPVADESSSDEEATAAEMPPAAIEPKSSRRNANSRGVESEDSSSPSSLTGPEQSVLRLNSASKIRRIPATTAPAGVDKN